MMGDKNKNSVVELDKKTADQKKNYIAKPTKKGFR